MNEPQGPIPEGGGVSRREFMKMVVALGGSLAAAALLPKSVRALGDQESNVRVTRGVERKFNSPPIQGEAIFNHAGIQVFYDGIPLKVGEGHGYIHPEVLANDEFRLREYQPGSRVLIQADGALVIEQPGRNGGMLSAFWPDGTTYNTDEREYSSDLFGVHSETRFVPGKMEVHTFQTSNNPRVTLSAYLDEAAPPSQLQGAREKYISSTRDTISAVCDLSSAVIMEGRNTVESNVFGIPEIPVGSMAQIRLGKHIKNWALRMNEEAVSQEEGNAILSQITDGMLSSVPLSDPGEGRLHIDDPAYSLNKVLVRFADSNAVRDMLLYYAESAHTAHYFSAAVREFSALCARTGFEKVTEGEFIELFELYCFRPYFSRDSLNTEESLVAATKNMLVDPALIDRSGPFWTPKLAGVIPVVAMSKIKERNGFFAFEKNGLLEDAFDAADTRGKELQKIPEKPRVVAYYEGRINDDGSETFYVVVQEINAAGKVKTLFSRPSFDNDEFRFWDKFAVDAQDIEGDQVGQRFLELGIATTQLAGNFAISYDKFGKPKSRIYNAALLEPKLILASDPAKFSKSPKLLWALPMTSGVYEFDIGGGIRNPSMLFLGEGKVKWLTRIVAGTSKEYIDERLWQPDVTHLANDARRRGLSRIATTYSSPEEMVASIVKERQRILANREGVLSIESAPQEESKARELLKKLMPKVTVFGVMQEDTDVLLVRGSGLVEGAFRGVDLQNDVVTAGVRLAKGDIIGVVEVGFMNGTVPYAVLGLDNPASLLERRYYVVPLSQILPKDKPTILDNFRVAEATVLAYISAMALPVGTPAAKAFAFKLLRYLFVPFSGVPLVKGEARMNPIGFASGAQRIMQALQGIPPMQG